MSVQQQYLEGGRFKLCISHEHLQYLRRGPRGFFEVGTTAFHWEVPADSVVPNRVRGESWPLLLPMVWLIDVLPFPQAAALLLPQHLLVSGRR